MIPEFPNINPRIRKFQGNPCRNEWGTCKLYYLVVFLNPFEKYADVKMGSSSPSFGMKIDKDLKPPPPSISYLRKKKLKIREPGKLKTMKIIPLTKENYLPNLHFGVQNVKCPGCIYNCSVGSRKGFFLTHHKFQQGENCVSYKFKDTLHITHPFIEFLGHHT